MANEVETCPRCNETQITTGPTNEVVCSACGLVLETPSLVVSEVQFSHTGTRTSAKVSANGNGPNKKRKAESNLDRIASLFSLNQHLSSQCFALLKDLKNRGNLARDSSLLAASIVLFVMKSNNKPVSMTDMAKNAGVNFFDLGRVYNKVEKLLQATPEVHHSLFVSRALSALKLDDAVASVVRTQADRLITIAKGDCISTGRHPIAVIAAALYLLLEAHSARMNVKNTYITGIAEALVVSERTIKARAAEIKKLLVAKYDSIKQIGGAQIKMTKNKLTENIPDILMMIDMGTAPSTNIENLTTPPTTIITTNRIDPPSFLYNQKLRERRCQKLERAKQRLFSTLTEGQVDPMKCTNLHDKPHFQEYDEEDRIIELLLLQGVPDETILTGYYDVDPTVHSTSVNIGSNSKELGEYDLPDEELHQFVRSEHDLEYEERLYVHTDKKVKNTNNSFRRKCFTV